MTDNSYANTVFANGLDTRNGISPEEARRIWKQGAEGERKIEALFRNNGWHVKNINKSGLYNEGYDLVVQKGDKKFFIECKSQAGVRDPGTKRQLKFNTFFCETHHAGGSPSGWCRPENNITTHFAVINRFSKTLYIFDRNCLAHYAINHPEKRKKSKCEGVLVEWENKEAGFKMSIPI